MRYLRFMHIRKWLVTGGELPRATRRYSFIHMVFSLRPRKFPSNFSRTVFAFPIQRLDLPTFLVARYRVFYRGTIHTRWYTRGFSSREKVNDAWRAPVYPRSNNLKILRPFPRTLLFQGSTQSSPNRPSYPREKLSSTVFRSLSSRRVPAFPSLLFLLGP